ncbi:MAG: TetR/AcrR family transcriptional regulator [Chloroflexi bacterium]|nr:TetR/AcrR family transcriptional regulator [Chloroflexota bacterium]
MSQEGSVDSASDKALTSSEQRQPRRRPAQRRAEILEAAAEVFARKGFERATTKEIAAQAGVSEGTLYNYFGGKRDILLALLNQMGESASAAIARMQNGSFEEMLAQLLADQIRMVHRRPLMILLLQQAVLDDEVGRAFDQMIAGLQRETMNQFATLFASGKLRTVDPFVAEEIVGSMMMGLTIGAELAERGWHHEPLSPEVLGKSVVDVIMKGLRART